MTSSLFSILIILIGYIIYYFFIRRPKYTRERYAFWATALLGFIIINTITYILEVNFLIVGFNYFLELIQLPTILIETPSNFDKILSFLLVLLLWFTIIIVFKNWKGAKSIHQHESERFFYQTNILKEAFSFIVDKKASKVYVSEENKAVEIYRQNHSSFRDKSWEVQVKELFSLESNQFIIDVDKDYYSNEHCYISSYGKNNTPLAIYCSTEYPEKDIMDKFIAFTQNEIKSDNVIYYLAIQEGDFDETIVLHGKKISVVSKSTLLKHQIDSLHNYFRAIKTTFEKNQIVRDYDYTLEQIYVEPLCLRKNDDFYIESIEKYVVDWLNDKKTSKQLALLGEYGQGKSVLSQRIAYKILNDPSLTDRIPIVVELRGKYPIQNDDLSLFFSEFSSKYNVFSKTLQILHEEGKLLIIFEGFDEVGLVGESSMRYEHFKKIWNNCLLNSKIIITGRPNYFVDKAEMETLLNIKGNKIYCEEIYIQKFDRERIEAVLNNFDAGMRKEILDFYDKYPNGSFADLISRPSSLFITGIIWNERNLSEKKDKLNSAFVINEYLLNSYSRQNEKKQKLLLSINERAFFMEGIAIYMVHKYGYTNKISKAELEEVTLKLVDYCPEELADIRSIGCGKKISERLNDKELAKESIITDVRACGVLVADISSSDTFTFGHKSYLELLTSNYLVASYLYKNTDSMEWMKYNAISVALGIKIEELLKTPEVFIFNVEQCACNIGYKKEQSQKQQIEHIFRAIVSTNIKINVYFNIIRITGIDILKGTASLLLILMYLITVVLLLLNVTFDNNFHLVLNWATLVIGLYILLKLHNSLIKDKSVDVSFIRLYYNFIYKVGKRPKMAY